MIRIDKRIDVLHTRDMTTNKTYTATSAYGNVRTVTIDERGFVWCGRVLMGDVESMERATWEFSE